MMAKEIKCLWCHIEGTISPFSAFETSLSSLVIENWQRAANSLGIKDELAIIYVLLHLIVEISVGFSR